MYRVHLRAYGALYREQGSGPLSTRRRAFFFAKEMIHTRSIAGPIDVGTVLSMYGLVSDVR